MNNTHSQRLEKWLGTERVENLSRSARGWYGPPIALLDVPGGIKVHGDGDFSGRFDRGYAACALDSLRDASRRYFKAIGKRQYGTLNTGFGSISDALSEAAAGKLFMLAGGNINRAGTTGVVAATNSLWRVGAQPGAGAAASAAPGGTVPTSASTGALGFPNPSGTDTTHLTGADMVSTVAAMSLLLYDRIFAVVKTMNSTGTEAVSGVPTRYTSTVAGATNSAEGNFLFMEAGTALAATAHNWTVCKYTSQGGTTGQSMPSLTGNSGNIVNRLDMPTGSWFSPLVAGDTGMTALTQMQCSALVATGAIDFVIGHPIGVMALPIANMMMPFDWLTNRQQVPRIFDSACLALLELSKSATTATTYSGSIYVTQG